MYRWKCRKKGALLGRLLGTERKVLNPTDLGIAHQLL
jgi:hypothetical protein